MGRVKGFGLKRMAKKLSGMYPGVFGADFSANKRSLRSMGLKMESKIEFNKLAGEITVITKKAARQKQEDEPIQAPVVAAPVVA